MFVVCLEGCHCVGKSEICRQFESMGYEVLDEGFMDMESACKQLNPQGMIMELSWINHWFLRLLRVIYSNKNDNKNKIIITDRSPYSAIAYTTGGDALRPVIRECIDNLFRDTGIKIFTIYIRVEPNVLWNRIQARLNREPSRLRYREGEVDWFNKIVGFYESFNLWDMKFDNSTHENNISNVAMNLRNYINNTIIQ